MGARPGRWAVPQSSHLRRLLRPRRRAQWATTTTWSPRASTSTPALPILHSRDLVNWTIVGHAAARLPSPRYDTPQHGKGVWAPSLRVHDGRFWIYFGDPDLGIFMTSAVDPRGPWEPLTLVQSASGWIDPCPLWDDDGSVYLVHAWAKSRAGFNSVLTLRRLSADGRRLADDTAVTVFDGTTSHPTIEGPKFYKRDGYYYIFAPAGGVTNGWQTVLRSKSVTRTVRGAHRAEARAHAVNGPHQGGWIETPSGESWFMHFQDRGAVRSHRASSADGLARRLAGDRRRSGRRRRRRAGGGRIASRRRRSPRRTREPQTSDEFDSRASRVAVAVGSEPRARDGDRSPRARDSCGCSRNHFLPAARTCGARRTCCCRSSRPSRSRQRRRSD